MPDQKVVRKVRVFLLHVKLALVEDNSHSITKALRRHRLAGEYCKILVDMGVLSKKTAGLRGRAEYTFNEAVIDNELCSRIIEEYNRRRAVAVKRYYKKRPRIKRDFLSEVRSQLKTIILTLNQIQDEIKKTRG